MIPDAEMEQLQSRKQQLEAELVRSRAQLDIAVIAVEKHRLLAPFSGVLQQSTPHPGERIEPGRVVAIILDHTRLTVQLELAPAEVLSLREGRLELLQLPAPDKPLVLRELAPAANPATGMVGLELYCCHGEAIPGQSLHLGLFNRRGKELVGR